MHVKTLILGAGAAGLMAAAHAGPNVLVVDHAKAPGEKIRISGGGRCNFTNMYCDFGSFLGANRHFHKSALSGYTQWDFIELVDRHKIAWHEKTLGQLFCDDKSTQIVAMLMAELQRNTAQLWLRTEIRDIRHDGQRFVVSLDKEGTRRVISAQNVVLATGGKSIPKMGATGLAYDIARQFGHKVTDTRPALVPFIFDNKRFSEISGISAQTHLTYEDTGFSEAMLFTHRGLSGPAVLQISSYWREGHAVNVNLLPEMDLSAHLQEQRTSQGKRALNTELGHLLPSRLVAFLAQEMDFKGNLADLSDKRIARLADDLQNWSLKPSGTEGYRTAEVTLGGVDTTGLDSKSMMSKHLSGLYVIGEAVDVTGWLGGYNFQWAWSSAMAAARHISSFD